MFSTDSILLTASIQGGVLIIATLLAHLLFARRLPKRTFLLLWTAALCRLLLPFSLPSPASLYQLLPSPPQTPPIDVVNISLVNFSPTEPVFTATAATSGTPFETVPWIPLWLGGGCLLAALLIFGWLREKRRLCDALPLEGNPIADEWLTSLRLRRTVRICTSDRIASPLSCGIIHPRIILPKSMKSSDQAAFQFVLRHELSHIRRFDGVWKFLFSTVCCIHWFNPLVWVMLFLSGRDIELSCDESVLQQCGRDARTGYAMSLISMAERRPGLPLLAHFSNNAITERITMIMKYKPRSTLSIFLGGLLTACLVLTLATSPVEAESDAESHISVTTSEIVLSDSNSISSDQIAVVPDENVLSSKSFYTITRETEPSTEVSAASTEDTDSISYSTEQFEYAVSPSDEKSTDHSNTVPDITITQAMNLSTKKEKRIGFAFPVAIESDSQSGFLAECATCNNTQLYEMGFTAAQVQQALALINSYPLWDNSPTLPRFSATTDTLLTIPVKADSGMISVTIGPYSMVSERSEALADGYAKLKKMEENGSITQSEMEISYLNLVAILFCSPVE